jgi:RNA polymerase sigma factor (sigma-70 family)
MSTVVITEPRQEFEGVFREHAPLVYRTAFGITGSHEDAEDVLQNIFLQLVRRELPPDLTNNPQAYLYRAAVNASLNIIRRRRREILVEGVEPFERPVEEPADQAESDERQLYDAIAALKPEAAQILLLRYMHNKTDVEIAKLLGRSRGAIALKLFRTRARLKKLLSRTFGDRS